MEKEFSINHIAGTNLASLCAGEIDDTLVMHIRKVYEKI